MNKNTVTIHPAAPFNFPLTADNQPYFREDGDADAGVYQRLLDLGDKLILASVRSEGPVGSPRLIMELEGGSLTPSEAETARRQMERLLGAAQELTPFYASAQTDPVMARLVQTFYGMHQPGSVSVFEAIVQAILGQQLAASVARVIRTLLIETYGPRRIFHGQQHYSFPRPEALAAAAVDDLRKLKLSQRKAEYLQGIACAELDTPGGLNRLRLLPDAEVVKEVTALRGVGKWTAQWVLVRALGRADAFPIGDLALRRIVSQLYFGGESLTDKQLEEFSQRWSPHRSLATHYLFTALRTGMS